MAVKDRTRQYDGIRDLAGTAPVPNTVSRDMRFGDRAFTGTVWESGKPILDSELTLHQDSAWWENYLLRRWQVPSGWLRGQSRYDSGEDWVLGFISDGAPTPADRTPDSSVGGGHIYDPGIPGAPTAIINALVLKRVEAIVAGLPVVAEYAWTDTEGFNIIVLDSPPSDQQHGVVKRTDFVFLEVWLALVAPSPKAYGQVQVDATLMLDGDTLSVGGTALVGRTSVVPGTFYIDTTDSTVTAANIANALNTVAPFSTLVSAKSAIDVVTIEAIEPGAVGNGILLSKSSAGLQVSDAHFNYGADRPNKPASSQGSLYRHGCVQSPSATWLADEIVDPVVDTESSQRIQVQWRFRVATDEAINYKTHPDGFSNGNGGGSVGTPMVVAQGAAVAPVTGYPFVPADKTSIWLNSSAPAWGVEDSGLWVAGDGSADAVRDLGTLDGFVYAIPVGFVFRHNDASTDASGWTPTHNANGAPLFLHGTYDTGSNGLGTIPAGVSDRPDAGFADVVTNEYLLDLRRHVMFQGVDGASELDFQIQSLLDGNNRTWALDSCEKWGMHSLNGDISTRFMVCNVIGRDPLDPIHADVGEFIRSFDHVCRRFAGQPVIERVVFAFWPGDRQAAVPVAPGLVNPGKYVVKAALSDTATWAEGDVLHLDLTQFNVTTAGSVFHGGDGGGATESGYDFVDAAPIGTAITDVLSIWHDDGFWSADPADAIDQRCMPKTVVGLGTPHLEITLDENNQVANGGVDGGSPHPLVFVVGTPPPLGSPRRIFVEVEITYPLGVGTTDTPLWPVTPDPTVYNGTDVGHVGLTQLRPGPGPQVVLDEAAIPVDQSVRLAPRFRVGFREVQLDYVANGKDHGGDPADPVDDDPNVEPLMGIVSRTSSTLFSPRRFWSDGEAGHELIVEDWSSGVGVPAAVDVATTEYGSSSRKIVVGPGALSAEQAVCRVAYQAQDPVPNFGAGTGYTVAVWYRAPTPQTAGIIEGDMTTGGGQGGTVPTELRIEPLRVNPRTFTAQVGMGSVDVAFPYATPMEQIAMMEGQATLDPDPTHIPQAWEWFFCASADVTVGDFDAATGMLALHSFVEADAQETWTLGGDNIYQKPQKDREFRALYPWVASASGYRPTVMAQPLFGATRHKVFVPVLARVVETVPGSSGGILFRKNEVVLVVLSRFAELDDDNDIRFVGDPYVVGPGHDEAQANAFANKTCATVYRTRNLLLTVGR